MVEHKIESGITARIISQETHKYLRGVVGIDGWVKKAIALKSYADQTATISDSDLEGVYLMLMGYALENLAKSIISCKAYDAKPADVTPFEEKLKMLNFLLDEGKTCGLNVHGLDKLYKAKDIGFKVSETEIDHLKAISIYTLWKGRYPVPLEIKQHSSPMRHSFNDLSSTARSIYDRAMVEVETLRP